MQAYSLDLRERIIQYWQDGEPLAKIARLFKVSVSTVKRYVGRFKVNGDVQPTLQRRMTGKLSKRLCKQLVRQVERHADATLAQQAERWNKCHAVKISVSCISRALRRMGYTRKKKTLGAVERDEQARAAFRELMAGFDPANVVVVDESGSRIGMVPL